MEMSCNMTQMNLLKMICDKTQLNMNIVETSYRKEEPVESSCNKKELRHSPVGDVIQHDPVAEELYMALFERRNVD